MAEEEGAAVLEEPQDGEDEEESQVVNITSLSDIEGDEVPDPDPIVLSWKARGKENVMVVKTKWPEEPDTFGLLYLERQDQATQPEYDDNGKATYPHAGAHELLLRQQCVKSPTWLKNKSAFEQFKRKVPPTVVEALHRRLRLVAGLDADFFEDFRTFTASAIRRMRYSASESASGSSPTKSQPEPPTAPAAPTGSESQPTTSTPDSDGTKSVSTESSTTPGSPQPSVPTETRKSQLRPIQPTAS